jgi:hypothetical protein
MAVILRMAASIWHVYYFTLGFVRTIGMMIMFSMHGKQPKKDLSPEERAAEEKGGKDAMATLWTWDSMVATGRGNSTIARFSKCKLSIGSSAPDGILHRYGTLNEVKLSSFFKPGRITVLNFGSYT